MTRHETGAKTEEITRTILVRRGQRVLLDSDLAALYGVTTKRFDEQIRRYLERFPSDFMFQRTANEVASLRSQFATLKLGRGQHRKYLPYVFSEHGAIMAATILNSPRAVEMSVYIARAFIQLREVLDSNTTFARKLNELEGKLQNHDKDITAILSAIRELMSPMSPTRRGIGFTANLDE